MLMRSKKNPDQSKTEKHLNYQKIFPGVRKRLLTLYST